MGLYYYKKFANSLLYNGTSFHVLNDKGESLYSVPAWSGKGEYMNKPEFTKIKGAGPIPSGTYTLGQRETNMQKDSNGHGILGWASNGLSNMRGVGKLWRFFTSKDYRDFSHFNNRKMYPNAPVFAKHPYGWGEYRFALKPDKGTDTFGRTNMYLHGGAEPGSLGCVDIGSALKHIVEARPELGVNKDTKLKVDYNARNIPVFKP